MLRYFYLLILLVCINWCFCYDYMQNQDIGYKVNDRRLGRISNNVLSRRRCNRNKNEKKRQSSSRDTEEMADSERIAQFNLVDFIQKPGRGKNREDPEYSANGVHNRQERQSEMIDNYQPILKPNYEENDDTKLSDLENIDRSFSKINQELNLNGPDIRQLYPTALIHRELNIGDVRNLEHKPFKRNSETEPNRVHKQQKKCLSNHFKIPFFSHKKETSAKKNVVIQKKDNTTTEPKKTEETKVNTRFLTSSYPRNERKVKRSFTDLLCPICKHRFTIDELETMKESQDYPVHNSRQYYQRIHTREAPQDEAGDKVMPPILDSLQSLSFKYVDKSPFIALEDVTNNQKETQLKEIAEVESKLANANINSTG